MLDLRKKAGQNEKILKRIKEELKRVSGTKRHEGDLIPAVDACDWIISPAGLIC